MKFKLFNFPTSTDAAEALQAVRELSENWHHRPAPKVLGCRPWREFVLVPIPAAARIISWHPALNSEPSTVN